MAIDNFNNNDKPDQVTPLMLDNPDLSNLKYMLSEYMKNAGNGGNREDDDHYIFEEVMMAFYGRNVFDYLNKLS